MAGTVSIGGQDTGADQRRWKGGKRLQIAICDDEQEQAQTLRAAVLAWAESAAHHCEIRVFPSAEAFWFANSADSCFDILLLDIEMTGQSGIDLAKRLRREGSRVEIIFVTSHTEFYGEGYEVDALHYLLKPVDAQKLGSVLTKAARQLETEPLFVIIRCEGDTVKLYERDILYVEASLHYIEIYTTDKSYRIKENLAAFGARLSEDFYHTHRSYYVSLKHVTRISRTSVTLDRGYELPLARGRYDDINRAYIERN